MRPIPATRLGDAHGLLRVIDKRGRLRTDEFVTEFGLDELFPAGLENALGRLRHFVSYARAAGLVKEDRGVVELTDVGRRYIRAGDPSALFAMAPQQAEWLRRQLREKHMTDSIFHGLAIGLSLLASCPPGMRVSTIDFGRSMARVGRAGWDSENTLKIQGERHLVLLTDMELIDGEHRLTSTGEQVRGELTLPVQLSLVDIAGRLNPGGPAAVRADAEREWAQSQSPPAGEQQRAPEPDDGNGRRDVGQPSGEPASQRPPIVPRAAAPPAPTQPAPPPGPPVAGTGGSRSASEPPVPDGPASVSPSAPGDTFVRASTAPTRPSAAPPPAAAPFAPQPAAAAPAVAPSERWVASISSPAGREPAPTGPAFVEAGAVRAAGEAAGLRLPIGLYANVAAALAAGKHLLLTGAPGAGKTALALAVARAAAQAGLAQGVTVVNAEHGWAPRELLIEAARRGRWVIVDELDRARPDRALGALSSFLAGIPVALAGGEEAAPAEGWRIVATWGGGRPRASPAVLRRFAVVDVVGPPAGELRAALHRAAGGDPVATGAAERLLALSEIAPLGAGVFLDAARHAAARQAALPTDAATLAREAYAAYVAPLLGDLDEDGERRVRDLLGSA